MSDAARTRKARPESWRITLRDEPAASTPLELPARRMWPAGLAVGAVFAAFAAILWFQIARLDFGRVNSVFDLSFVAFELFWILGWSVGVLFLGALTLLLLCYGESARLEPGRLILVPRLGPLKFLVGYDLRRVRNLRAETVGGDPDKLRVRFDYAEGHGSIGDTMSRADADRVIATIRRAAPDTTVQPSAPARIEAPPPPQPLPANTPAPPPLPLTSPSSIALIAANLLPLAGVLLGHWRLGDVMLLFWSESAIIGFFTVLKIAMAGRWSALLSAPFFVGHFGGFMAGHFLFVYGFFLEGFATNRAGPGIREVLVGMFTPLWPAMAALFASHAVSFAVNFIGHREYTTATVRGLMSAPYRRIALMHVTIIFGGWLAMLLATTAPALALLIALKIAVDLRAHRREHGIRSRMKDEG